MAQTSRKTQQEIEQLISGYQESGLSRREYCEQHKIPVTTLDYYRQRHRKQSVSSGQLVQVELQESRLQQEWEGFTIVLTKGRRIEMGWGYAEQHLARLIRTMEAV
jgi:UDP-N-acetylmuramoylalanine-D-glutamate ligase